MLANLDPLTPTKKLPEGAEVAVWFTGRAHVGWAKMNRAIPRKRRWTVFMSLSTGGVTKRVSAMSLRLICLPENARVGRLSILIR